MNSGPRHSLKFPYNSPYKTRSGWRSRAGELKDDINCVCCTSSRGPIEKTGPIVTMTRKEEAEPGQWVQERAVTGSQQSQHRESRQKQLPTTCNYPSRW
eukprot:751421-Pelagomonas_calceolata.AAC.1